MIKIPLHPKKLRLRNPGEKATYRWIAVKILQQCKVVVMLSFGHCFKVHCIVYFTTKTRACELH